MPNLSGIKRVQEVIISTDVIIYDTSMGGLEKIECLKAGREYIVPEYQREIK